MLRRMERAAAAALAAPDAMAMEDVIGGDDFDTLVDTPESREE